MWAGLCGTGRSIHARRSIEMRYIDKLIMASVYGECGLRDMAKSILKRPRKKRVRKKVRMRLWAK